MKTATTICGTCGAKISGNRAEEVCPACLLESLGLLVSESVAGVVDRANDGQAPASADKKNCAAGKNIHRLWGLRIAGNRPGRPGRSLSRTSEKSEPHVALKVIGLGPWTTATHPKRFRREPRAPMHCSNP